MGFGFGFVLGFGGFRFGFGVEVWVSFGALCLNFVALVWFCGFGFGFGVELCGVCLGLGFSFGSVGLILSFLGFSFLSTIKSPFQSAALVDNNKIVL